MKTARRSVLRRVIGRLRMRPGGTSGASSYIILPTWQTSRSMPRFAASSSGRLRGTAPCRRRPVRSRLRAWRRIVGRIGRLLHGLERRFGSDQGLGSRIVGEAVMVFGNFGGVGRAEVAELIRQFRCQARQDLSAFALPWRCRQPPRVPQILAVWRRSSKLSTMVASKVWLHGSRRVTRYEASRQVHQELKQGEGDCRSRASWAQRWPGGRGSVGMRQTRAGGRGDLLLEVEDRAAAGEGLAAGADTSTRYFCRPSLPADSSLVRRTTSRIAVAGRPESPMSARASGEWGSARRSASGRPVRSMTGCRRSRARTPGFS